MITFTQGNLLTADAEALVNTVNTVGVMGKGIALMFKEAFPENFAAYKEACDQGRVQLGKMFVTRRDSLLGPKWIINFPTKAHWRNPSQAKWIEEGLADLVRVVRENGINSIAIPPLGSGNGGLDWSNIRPLIENAFAEIRDVKVVVYEPTAKYQNVAKHKGVEKLTASRALIAEMVRRYSILGIECTLLEVQKLGYFLERFMELYGLENEFQFHFSANKYGPYSERLKHLLDSLDGSYLHCDKRLADAGPFDQIRFDYAKKDKISAFLVSPDVKKYRPVLEATTNLIDGLESPHGMELLSTVDWLIHHGRVEPSVTAVKVGLSQWIGSQSASQRKLTLFDERVIAIALETLASSELGCTPSKTNAE